MTLESVHLNHQIPVRAWVPENRTQQTPVVLFLHGRGYAVVEGSTDLTMIEAAGLEEWLNSESYQSNPVIVIAPQDTTTQNDGDGKGNDYWLGADGRNWENFFIEELKPAVRSRFALANEAWFTLGISMGAHGAMKLALDYPTEFSAFVSLSPIFRSSEAELGNDRDVFWPENTADRAEALRTLAERNIGARLLQNAQQGNQLQNVPHWVDIHAEDFGLNPTNFPSARQVWTTLHNRSTPTSGHVEIVHDNSNGTGHSMTYWQSRLPLALDWLVRQ